MKETLKGILCADYPDLALKKSGLTKTDIKPLADQGDLDAMLVLLFSEFFKLLYPKVVNI